MKNKIIQAAAVFFIAALWSCNSLKPTNKVADTEMPGTYASTTAGDTSNIAGINWRTYFNDPVLTALIDTALRNNRELNILTQEIEISKNEVRTRKGEYLPLVGIGAGAEIDKPGRYTRNGAVEEQLNIKEDETFPEPFTDFSIGAVATWEIDLWKKLRNAKQAAVATYLAGVEGKNFMTTQLIAEIAEAYYDLLALDNMLQIIGKNIEIQSSALNVIKQQKEAAKVTQLAVNRFEAQLLNTRNLQFDVKQRIIETENRINFLTGRFPEPISRNAETYLAISIDSMQVGLPADLLTNRPDIRQAELELEAAKLDLKVARAGFYPSLSISAGAGYNTFNPAYLLNPESMIYNLAGELMAPLINRNAIKAAFNTADAQQLQAVYNYEQKLIEAYIDVSNQLAKIQNTTESYQVKSKEVEILRQSINIANSLFNSARADYAEVLLTQREALEAKLELIEIKREQLSGKVNIYRSLGGGWN